MKFSIRPKSTDDGGLAESPAGPKPRHRAVVVLCTVRFGLLERVRLPFTAARAAITTTFHPFGCENGHPPTMKSDETTSKRGGIGINHLTVRPANWDDEQEDEPA